MGTQTPSETYSETKPGPDLMTPYQQREEIFKFHKSITVNFDFTSEVINQGFDGLLFMDWLSDQVATVALSMDGHKPDIFVKAHFLDDFTLRCMEIPNGLTENETDYILLLKNLILDYSFKTNRDDNGEYLALLKIKDLPGGLKQATKVKSKYITGPKIAKSLHEIKLGRSIIEARGEEHFQLPNASSRANYRLVATKGQEKPKINLERELGECTNEFSQQTTVTRATPEEFRENLLNMTTQDRGARHGLMRKLLKALRSNPELLADFMEWVHTIQEDRKLSSLATGMLGNLGTPEAQKELITLFNSATEKTNFLYHQTLNAFTVNSFVITSESREFLKSQINGTSPHLAEGATYALGTSIQNDPDKKDMQYLLNKLEQEEDLSRKGIYVDALSNAGIKFR
ncbi:MAG TPA: hypothetical protein VNJ08_04360 [Bacteriovoracaceae bacterium]|nr:hypothetical protein [Bacteriovoracaceae bacterium]